MKIKLLSFLMNLKRNTQVSILIQSDKSEIIRGKVKDIIKSEPLKSHRYDKVEKINESRGYMLIEISLDL